MLFFKKLKNILQSNNFFIILFFLLFLWIIYNFLFVYNNSKYDISTTFLEGIIEDISIDGDRLKMIIKGEEKVVCFYTFITEEEKNNFSFELGDTVYLEGVMKEANKASNHYVFNYFNYLKNKQIHYLFQIKKMKVIKKNNDFFFFIRQKIIDRIEDIEYGKEYLHAFLLGNTSYFDSEKLDMYQKLGVSHLFAISGMHVNFFISIFSKNKKDNRKDFFLLVFLLFYLILLNFKSSAFFSIVFYLLKKISFWFKISYSNFRLFFLTTFLLLLFFPFSFLEQSFIYSFCLRIGLLFFLERKDTNYLFSNFYLSLFSFFVTIPLNIYYSSYLNFFSIFFNLFFVPFVNYLLFPFSIITFFLPFLSKFLFLFIEIMEGIGEVFLIVPFGYFFMKPSLWFVFILFIILIFASKKKIFLYVFLICLLIFKVYPSCFGSDYLMMIDVGEGDALLLHIGNKNLLIDTGGSFSYTKEEWRKKKEPYNITDSVLLPIFNSLGISKLDFLILSHGDYDHMGEAINLVNNFKVEKVIFNCGEFNDLEKDLIEVLDDKKIPYYSCIKELNFDDNKLYFLNNKLYDNENDNSSVIYTELNNHKFLFMGDAGIDVEGDLIEKYNLQDIDVLKVGHHGSKTSSSKVFIDEIEPKYSIISVGKNNRYGHPNNNVLETLEDSKIYRTDQDGSVMFKLKKNKLQIETCVP